MIYGLLVIYYLCSFITFFFSVLQKGLRRLMLSLIFIIKVTSVNQLSYLFITDFRLISLAMINCEFALIHTLEHKYHDVSQTGQFYTNPALQRPSSHRKYKCLKKESKGFAEVQLADNINKTTIFYFNSIKKQQQRRRRATSMPYDCQRIASERKRSEREVRGLRPGTQRADAASGAGSTRIGRRLRAAVRSAQVS